MAHRLTDTTIWTRQKWFKKMPVLYKLAWKYLTDVCNHAGIWKIDLSELIDDLGEDSFDLTDFIDWCNRDFDKQTGRGISRKRVQRVGTDHLWLTGFLAFQYGKDGAIRENFNAASSAIKVLQNMGLYEQAIDCKYFTHIPYDPTKKKNKGSGGLPTLEDSPEQSETVVDSKSKSIGKSISKSNSIIERIESVLVKAECLKDLEGEEEKKEFYMLIQEMLSDFEKRNENYYVSEEVDFPALLQIAYHICKEKKWLHSHAVLEKKKEVIASWNRILDFLSKTADNRFYKLSIHDISTSKRFQSIILAMRNANEGNKLEVQAMICPKMISIYKARFPKGAINIDSDFANCYEIAVLIAKTKEWPAESIGNGKMNDILGIWEAIVKFMETDGWYASRTLKDLSSPNEWQRLVNKLETGKNVKQQTSNAAPLKRIGA